MLDVPWLSPARSPLPPCQATGLSTASLDAPPTRSVPSNADVAVTHAAHKLAGHARCRALASRLRAKRRKRAGGWHFTAETAQPPLSRSPSCQAPRQRPSKPRSRGSARVCGGGGRARDTGLAERTNTDLPHLARSSGCDLSREGKGMAAQPDAPHRKRANTARRREPSADRAAQKPWRGGRSTSAKQKGHPLVRHRRRRGRAVGADAAPAGRHNTRAWTQSPGQFGKHTVKRQMAHLGSDGVVGHLCPTTAPKDKKTCGTVGRAASCATDATRVCGRGRAYLEQALALVAAEQKDAHGESVARAVCTPFTRRSVGGRQETAAGAAANRGRKEAQA
ncbi:hypothetical protein (fragment) [Trypanosoma vivax Y486]|uniref:Uncharacterized protein n=1 Tax=Trypanosoma vivax (strain Y486) TaxID=1055687 RepID=F9WRQ1_TRYVY